MPLHDDPWVVSTVVLAVVSLLLIVAAVVLAVYLSVAEKREETRCELNLFKDFYHRNPKADIVLKPVPTPSSPPAKGKWTKKIPPMIYQTHKMRQIPERMAHSIHLMQQRNCCDKMMGYEFFDDREAREFLRTEMGDGGRALRAFDALGAGAFKADLFRYCLLFKRGGLYVDADMLNILPFDDVLRDSDEFVSVVDRADASGMAGAIYQAFIASVPGHPILRLVIDLVCDRIERGETGTSPLHMTGPHAMGTAFKAWNRGQRAKPGEYAQGVRLWKHEVPPDCSEHTAQIIDNDGHAVFWIKYPGYVQDSQQFPLGKKTKHYGDIWKKGKAVEV